MLLDGKALDDLFSKLSKAMKLIKLRCLFSLWTSRGWHWGKWKTSQIMCFVSDNLGYSLCTFTLSREFTFPCLCPVDCTSGFSGKEKSAEASSGRSRVPQLRVTVHGSCSFPNCLFSQCQVLGQWVIPLDPNEGRRSKENILERSNTCRCG